MTYEESEDSFLLQRYVKIYAKGRVLDIGTGSGILALKALENTKDVLATDIDNEAIKEIKKKGINVIYSDLFTNIKGKFDLIIFNPPYLPGNRYRDLDGGKEGYEVIEKFLEKARYFLKKDGKILLLYSSLSMPRKINEFIKKYDYSYRLLETKKLAFEKLYVILLKNIEN